MTPWKFYRAWRAARPLAKAWKEAVMILGDKPVQKSVTMGGAALLFGPELYEQLVKLILPTVDLLEVLGVPPEVREFVKRLVPLIQAVGGLMIIIGLRRAKSTVAASVLALGILVAGTLGLAQPLEAGAIFNLGPTFRTSWAIPSGGSLGDARASSLTSAAGYYERDKIGITAEFGGTTSGGNEAAGLWAGPVIRGWIYPSIGIDSRRLSGDAGIAISTETSFFIPLSEKAGSTGRIGLRSSYFGEGSGGGWAVSIAGSILTRL